jgi:hypothetical protein
LSHAPYSREEKVDVVHILDLLHELGNVGEKALGVMVHKNIQINAMFSA